MLHDYWKNHEVLGPQSCQILCDPMDYSPLGSSIHGVLQGRILEQGNGNPLPCSCLENPRDGGAWQAAVYGVAQSRTQLKRLSNSNSRECDSCQFITLAVFISLRLLDSCPSLLAPRDSYILWFLLPFLHFQIQ